MKPPKRKDIKFNINELRAQIELDKLTKLESRVAQIIEETLRWTIEKTDWDEPFEQVKEWAEIIEND